MPSPDRNPAARPARDLVLALALACPAGALVAAGLTAAPYANPDSHAFEALARSLQQGLGFTYREPMMPGLELKAFRSPAYGAFLAGSLAAGGVQLALALQGALAAATAVLLADLARRTAGLRAAAITLGMLLLWGQPWRYAGELMTESLYTFSVALVLWLAAPFAGLATRTSHENARAVALRGGAGDLAAAPVRAVLLGGALALAVLARPSGFAVAAALAVVMLRRAPRALAIAALVAVLAWAPWPARNAAVLHAFVPSLTNGGLNAWNGATRRPIGEGWEIQAANASLGEVGLDRMFWRLARAEVSEHPRQAVARFVARLGAYAGPPPARPEQWMLVAAWPLALLGAWSLATGAARGRALFGLAGAAWAWQALMASLVVVNERYRFPTDPLVVLAGALGAETLVARLGPLRGGVAAGAIGAAFLALVTIARRLI